MFDLVLVADGNIKIMGPSDQVCVLCGKTFDEFGNNPEPLADIKSGDCCNDCNITKVMPARF